MLKILLKSLLKSHGLELKAVGAPVRGASNYIQRLKSTGFCPGTIVDVGVARGTPWLYQFPDAKLVLVEPNDEFTADLDRIKRRTDADIYLCAAGAESGELPLNVDVDTPTSSSLYSTTSRLNKYRDRNLETNRQYDTKQVEVRPLDSILDNQYAAPYLIKIDTEGHELEALRGATIALEKTTVLIIEASVARRFEGSYEFSDLVHFLAGVGFRLCDILEIASFHGDGDIAYMDIAFTRAGARPE